MADRVQNGGKKFKNSDRYTCQTVIDRLIKSIPGTIQFIVYLIFLIPLLITVILTALPDSKEVNEKILNITRNELDS